MDSKQARGNHAFLGAGLTVKVTSRPSQEGQRSHAGTPHVPRQPRGPRGCVCLKHQSGGHWACPEAWEQDQASEPALTRVSTLWPTPAFCPAPLGPSPLLHRPLECPEQGRAGQGRAAVRVGGVQGHLGAGPADVLDLPTSWTCRHPPAHMWWGRGLQRVLRVCVCVCMGVCPTHIRCQGGGRGPGPTLGWEVCPGPRQSGVWGAWAWTQGQNCENPQAGGSCRAQSSQPEPGGLGRGAPDSGAGEDLPRRAWVCQVSAPSKGQRLTADGHLRSPGREGRL